MRWMEFRSTWRQCVIPLILYGTFPLYVTCPAGLGSLVFYSSSSSLSTFFFVSSLKTLWFTCVEISWWVGVVIQRRVVFKVVECMNSFSSFNEERISNFIFWCCISVVHGSSFYLHLMDLVRNLGISVSQQISSFYLFIHLFIGDCCGWCQVESW